MSSQSGPLAQYRAEAFTRWPTRLLGAHWSVHPQATRPELTPVFLAPPLWMCEPAE